MLVFRIVQELLEDVDSLSIEIGVESPADLVECLLGLPLVLVQEDLVVLAIQSEELLLVLVGDHGDIDICSLS